MRFFGVSFRPYISSAVECKGLRYHCPVRLGVSSLTVRPRRYFGVVIAADAAHNPDAIVEVRSHPIATGAIPHHWAVATVA